MVMNQFILFHKSNKKWGVKSWWTSLFLKPNTLLQAHANFKASRARLSRIAWFRYLCRVRLSGCRHRKRNKKLFFYITWLIHIINIPILIFVTLTFLWTKLEPTCYLNLKDFIYYFICLVLTHATKQHLHLVCINLYYTPNKTRFSLIREPVGAWLSAYD
jgi:hypothetical protein